MKYAITIVTLLATLVIVTPGAHAQSCPGFEASAEVNQRLENDQVDESSGLAASARHPGLLWTHNDSGDEPRLFLLDGTGKHVGTLELADVKLVDTEDIAVAPCERGASESCIYLGDIGDNRARRPQLVVYKFREPALPDARPFDLEVDGIERITLRYREGARDAETLIVHPETLELFIVEKSPNTQAGVWRAKADTRGQPDVQIASRVSTVQVPSPLPLGRYVTAGDISPDGSRVTLRTYLSVFTWCVAEGESLAEAFERDPTVSATPGLLQSEALAYDRDGQSIWLTSERRPTPLIRLRTVETDEQPDATNDEQ